MLVRKFRVYGAVAIVLEHVHDIGVRSHGILLWRAPSASQVPRRLIRSQDGRLSVRWRP
jgi:hypothetical protein